MKKASEESIVDINTFFKIASQHTTMTLYEYKLINFLVYDTLCKPHPCEYLSKHSKYIEALAEYLSNTSWINLEEEKLRSINNHSNFYSRNQHIATKTFVHHGIQNEKFITMQQPTSLHEIWNVIQSKGINLIISLNNMSLKYRKQFWPNREDGALKPTSSLILTYESSVDCGDYTEDYVLLTNLASSKPIRRTVKIIQLKRWFSPAVTPDNTNVFINLHESMKNEVKNETVLVVCL